MVASASGRSMPVSLSGHQRAGGGEDREFGEALGDVADAVLLDHRHVGRVPCEPRQRVDDLVVVGLDAVES